MGPFPTSEPTASVVEVAPLLRTSLALATALALAPVGTAAAAPYGTQVEVSRSHASAQAPRLRVRTVVRGLQHPWDVQQGPRGRLLVSERDRARVSVVRRGKRRTLASLERLVWVSGETGLLSLAVDTGSRTVWACHGAMTGDGPEVRVTRWKVDRRWRRLSHRRVVIDGLPSTSGRHGGCRLMLARAGRGLLVGTGDAAVGTNPRDLVLTASAVDPGTGTDSTTKRCSTNMATPSAKNLLSGGFCLRAPRKPSERGTGHRHARGRSRACPLRQSKCAQCVNEPDVDRSSRRSA